MSQIAAIYGFSFTTAFEAAGLSFKPAFKSHSEAEAAAREIKAYNLTGTVSADELGAEMLYRLEAVLAFIERLDVLISDPVFYEGDTEVIVASLPPRIVSRARNNGGGSVIGSDAFGAWRESRKSFIHLAMERLADADYCQRTRLNSLLFKSVETFRQRKPFLEISYFLLASGLEAFCRAAENDYVTKNAAAVISKTLQSHGFTIFENKPSVPGRSVQTYLHLRNALFHRGDFSATVQSDDQTMILNCSEHLFSLSMLVSLLTMKAVGFDDGHINWDSWIDRQPFK